MSENLCGGNSVEHQDISEIPWCEYRASRLLWHLLLWQNNYCDSSELKNDFYHTVKLSDIVTILYCDTNSWSQHCCNNREALWMPWNSTCQVAFLPVPLAGSLTPPVASATNDSKDEEHAEHGFPSDQCLKVRTDTIILVRRTRYRTNWGGSFGSPGYIAAIRPNLAHLSHG